MSSRLLSRNRRIHNVTMPTPLRGKTESGDARPFTFQLYRYSAFDNRGSRLAKTTLSLILRFLQGRLVEWS